MSIKEILETYLEKSEYDGFFREDIKCFCHGDGLGNCPDGVDWTKCEGGIYITCDCHVCEADCEFHIGEEDD